MREREREREREGERERKREREREREKKKTVILFTGHTCSLTNGQKRLLTNEN